MKKEITQSSVKEKIKGFIDSFGWPRLIIEIGRAHV